MIGCDVTSIGYDVTSVVAVMLRPLDMTLRLWMP